LAQTGDHLGRKGLTTGGGVGLVVGLFAPPLLASAVVGGAAGGLIGKFARHKVETGLGEKLGAALPPGTAGLIAIYDRAKADVVDKTLVSAVRKSVARSRRWRCETAQGRPGGSAGRDGWRLSRRRLTPVDGHFTGWGSFVCWLTKLPFAIPGSGVFSVLIPVLAARASIYNLSPGKSEG